MGVILDLLLVGVGIALVTTFTNPVLNHTERLDKATYVLEEEMKISEEQLKTYNTLDGLDEEYLTRVNSKDKISTSKFKEKSTKENYNNKEKVIADTDNKYFIKKLKGKSLKNEPQERSLYWETRERFIEDKFEEKEAMTSEFQDHLKEVYKTEGNLKKAHFPALAYTEGKLNKSNFFRIIEDTRAEYLVIDKIDKTLNGYTITLTRVFANIEEENNTYYSVSEVYGEKFEIDFKI